MAAPKILTALLTLLLGCAPIPVQTTELPVTDQQRALTAASISRLRDQFNQNDCLSIYREASEIFRHQREKDWLSDCAELRARVGAWQTFTHRGTSRFGQVYGLAVFDRATAPIYVSWIFDRGRAELSWILIGNQGEERIFGGQMPFADPPPARPPDAV
jgi:hypothetical protein